MADPETPETGPHIQPLHLADPLAQIAQRDAASGPALVDRQQQASPRRCIVTGQAGELLAESLKPEIEAQGLHILQEELAGFGNATRSLRLQDFEDHGGGSYHPVFVTLRPKVSR